MLGSSQVDVEILNNFLSESQLCKKWRAWAVYLKIERERATERG